MCGIVGMISQTTAGFTRPQLDGFADLLMMDVVRGQDSTGVMGIAKDASEVRVAKATGPATTLLAEDDFDIFDQWAYQKGRMVVGHNRAATRGAKTDANAHPFHEGKIVLLHNGTLTTWHDLKGSRNDIEVDSHAIAHALNQTDDYMSVLSKINGAFVLVWFDMVENVMRIASNGERPLWFARSKDVTMFASEYGLLGAVANRRNIKLEVDGDGYTFNSMKAHTVLEFEVSNPSAKPRIIEIPRRSYSVTATTSGGTKSEKKGNAASSGDKNGNNAANARSLFHKYIDQEVLIEVLDIEDLRGTASQGRWVTGAVIDGNDAAIDGMPTRMFIGSMAKNIPDFKVGDFMTTHVANVATYDGELTFYTKSTNLTVMEGVRNVTTMFRQTTNSKEYQYTSTNGHRFSSSDTLGWRHGTTCDMCGIDMEHIDYAQGYVELNMSGSDANSLVCYSCHSERIC